MYKILLFISLFLFTTALSAQIIGRVDKRTKGFFIPADQQGKYLVFGFQFPSAATKKMICFSNSADNLRANYQCPLGAYFDTGQMGPGDNIIFLGMYSTFGKMVYNAGNGTKTIFYLPKTSFTIK
ncbi:MAG TPA: hypothetical protein VGQ51_09935 [Puia sp.]|nr:hypothetical protein [Puia sp.]